MIPAIPHGFEAFKPLSVKEISPLVKEHRHAKPDHLAGVYPDRDSGPRWADRSRAAGPEGQIDAGQERRAAAWVWWQEWLWGRLLSWRPYRPSPGECEAD